MEDCYICNKHHLLTKTTKLTFDEGEDFIVAHAPDRQGKGELFVGALIVEPKRHVKNWSELTTEESAQLGLLLKTVNQMLYEHPEVEHVYTWVFGDAVEHFHIWVVPRYKDTPKEFWGVKFNEWPAAPKGGPAEVAKFIAELQSIYNEGRQPQRTASSNP